MQYPECRVKVPRQWLGDLEKTGALGTVPDDGRRYPRFHYHNRAILRYRQTLPVLMRPARDFVVLTNDISRNGISFLHEEQLFPRERMTILLPDGKEADIEVTRCARVNKRCFEIGAFVFPAHDGRNPDEAAPAEEDEKPAE